MKVLPFILLHLYIYSAEASGRDENDHDCECPPTPTWETSPTNRYLGFEFESLDHHWFDTEGQTDYDPMMQGQKICDEWLSSSDLIDQNKSMTASKSTGKQAVSGVRNIVHSKGRSSRIQDDVIQEADDDNFNTSPADVVEECSIESDSDYYNARLPCGNRRRSTQHRKEARQRQEETRVKLEHLWEARNLNTKMKPKALALELMKIKIESGGGIDKGVGSIASAMVNERANTDYYAKYQLKNKRYMLRLKYLIKKVQDNDELKEMSNSKKIKYYLKHIDGLKERDFERNEGRGAFRPTVRMHDADWKATQVWALLTEHVRNLSDDDDIDVSKLRLDQIEELSRSIQLLGTSLNATTKLLKRYMKRILQKEDSYLDDFTILRNQYWERYSLEVRQINTEKRRNANDATQAKRRSKSST